MERPRAADLALLETKMDEIRARSRRIGEELGKRAAEIVAKAQADLDTIKDKGLRQTVLRAWPQLKDRQPWPR
jgi:hypothetical protein